MFIDSTILLFLIPLNKVVTVDTPIMVDMAAAVVAAITAMALAGVVLVGTADTATAVAMEVSVFIFIIFTFFVFFLSRRFLFGSEFQQQIAI